MNITEDFCSVEVVKLLKEKGFPIWEYHKSAIGVFNGIAVSNITKELIEEKMLSCVPHSAVMKYLREEKNIIIVIQPEYFDIEAKCSSWGVDIWADDNYEKLQGDFPSYKEAVNAALKHVLENLI